jgi:excinuclease ABC subunit A
MDNQTIVIRGAREHNLRSVNLDLPRNKLIVFTGVSGSGKSSLAFDTLYAEGQRRYVESLSSYARQFLGQLQKPDVDYLSGLSPAISIQQKTAGRNPRSTVGTITEIFDYLRVLYARIGQGHCPRCGRPITAQTREQIIGRILALPEGTRFFVLAPVIRGQKGEYKDLFEDMLKRGFVRARVDGKVVRLSDDLKLDRRIKHHIEIIVDRLKNETKVRPRLAEAVEQALTLGEGSLIVAVERSNVSPKRKQGTGEAEEAPSPPAPLPRGPGRGEEEQAPLPRGPGRGEEEQAQQYDDLLLSSEYACTHCNISYEPPSPQMFSFNSPQGMCPDCDGLGNRYTFDPELLIPDPAKSFFEGAVPIVGPLRHMGRWRKHIYEGVAKTLGIDLKTPWYDLPEEHRRLLLHGAGETHITYEWKQRGGVVWKHGGKWEGIVPQLLSSFKKTAAGPRRLQLEKYMRVVRCEACGGQRLKPQARAVRVGGKTLIEVCALPIGELAQWFAPGGPLETGLQPIERTIAQEVLKEIRGRVGFLLNVGLHYLTLDRPAPTLSGGEAQRIRLAGQIGCGLVGVLYILDEPSIGLHQRDNERLLRSLEHLRDMGNTVVVVEHDEETMRAADYLVDFGPGPGVRGGEVVAAGSVEQVLGHADSLTARYLTGAAEISVPAKRRAPTARKLTIHGARHHNLKNIDVEIPLGLFVCVTGVSGSGKSSLINDILKESLLQRYHVRGGEEETPSPPAPLPRKRGRGEEDGSSLVEGESPSPPAPLPRKRGRGEEDGSSLVEGESPSPPASRPRKGGRGEKDGSSLVEGESPSPPAPLPHKGGRGEEDPGTESSPSPSLAGEGGNPPTEANDENGTDHQVGEHDDITGADDIDKVIDIDQSPIGRTPRSNPATYIKVFDEIRALFAGMTDAKVRGYQPGRFSFNKPGGRCESCEGNGSNRLEMDFLADVWVTCPVCLGKRFNRETLHVRFKGKNIHDVLEMDVQEAVTHFANQPRIKAMLQTLHDVGLDYLKLGQPSPTLSGGEAQRIKLARELCKRSTGKTFYILDEPTTGLHFDDIRKLLEVLHGFVEGGNTVLVIEHNLDVIKTADWVIDLGPEGGSEGGEVVCAGTPEEVARCPQSHTGHALKNVLRRTSRRPQPRQKPRTKLRNGKQIRAVTVQGAQQHNLKNITVSIPREEMTVCSGPSGSGKSSLALDTVYAEGQRRYIESLSAYARQFLGQMQKPRVEHVSGLSPAISIEQKSASKSPRSTVGTVTEVYDYLRILYARLGQPYCPYCQVPIGTQTVDEIIGRVLGLPEGTRLYLMSPVERHGQERYDALWDEIRRSGFVRIRVDGKSYNVEEPPDIDHRRKHQVEVVVDRIIVRSSQRSRIADAVEAALDLGRGVMHVAHVDDGKDEPKWKVERFSQHMACDRCGRSFEPLNPHHFSFNSPLGWCPSCEGLGVQQGASAALLIRDPSQSLREGAISEWPALTEDNPFLAFAEAIARHVGFSLDSPFEKLEPAHQQAVLQGTGEAWISLASAAGARGKGEGRHPIRFQYKGVFPAIDEASRVSPAYRQRLEHLVSEVACSTCQGSRLRRDAAAARFLDFTIGQLCAWPLARTLRFFRELKLTKEQRQVAGELLREIVNRLQFLVDVGLDYLSLGRPAPTLSGGESQRIRLASQIGSGLTGVLYVLDEPTIGLHPRDNRRLLQALVNLRNLGNTLLLVEHDREVIAAADYLLDFGPGAGADGGEITAQGTPEIVMKSRTSLTGQYLSGRKAIAVPSNRRLSFGREPLASAETAHDQGSRPNGTPALIVRGARHNNLKSIDVRIPLGAFVAVTGVSGSGKSSLVYEVLYNTLARKLHRARTTGAAHQDIVGLEQIDKVISVDQGPIGNSPSSNPATYTGVFDLIRQLFAQVPEAKVRGYQPKRFSFNKPGGRCEACEGNGQKKIEMHFLPDVWVECDVCHGDRYNPETLAVRYKGKSIADVLRLRISEALELFGNIPGIRRILQTLADVGLGYLSLGQPAPTLSGGEAQRVKLAAELSRPNTGRTLYLLDEPTTGLHFDDIHKLLEVLNRLVDLGNTVVVVEHNLDVIKTADWIIDLGPEAGEAGGYLVAEGPPEEIADVPVSHTGQVLRPVLQAGPFARREKYDPLKAQAPREGDLELAAVGKDARMPWEIDGRRWHTQDRVSHKGTAGKWDGAILDWLDEQVHQLGSFAPTNWNHRSVVEIAPATRSQGWFLHMMTGLDRTIRVVFRVSRNAFKVTELTERLGIRPLDQIEGLQVYGHEERVQVRNRRGPWQDVAILAHSLAEIDTPAFRKFLSEAVRSFEKNVKRMQTRPEDVMPWKIAGERWHLGEKGFPPGKKLKWDRAVLPRLIELVQSIEPNLEIRWDTRDAITLYVPGITRSWAQWRTKDPSGLICRFVGKKGQFNLSQIEKFGKDPQILRERDETDILQLVFLQADHVHPADLKERLAEHLRGFREVHSD